MTPAEGASYDYDALPGILDDSLTDLDLTDVTLVGFSMGGEAARYVSLYGEERLHSVVCAAAVTPYLLTSEDDPDGPLPEDAAGEMRSGLGSERDVAHSPSLSQEPSTTCTRTGHDPRICAVRTNPTVTGALAP